MSVLKRVVSVLSVVAVAALLPISGSQAATYFYHTDHLGTPQALTDKNQQVVWRGEQEPFGEVDATTNAVEQNIRFPGQYYDVETGLHYNYFRDYDNFLGRYVQSDPVGLIGGLNTYLYSLNNPINLNDPYGLWTLGYSGSVTFGADYGQTHDAKKAAGYSDSDELNLTGSEINTGTINIGTDVGIETRPPDVMCQFDNHSERCRKEKENCSFWCQNRLPTTDFGFQFFNCVNKCLEKVGCL